MEAILVILIVAIGPLSILFGADSRLDENAWRRRWRDLT
jgi:hypothetical protein